MTDSKDIFTANRDWVERMCASDPAFFTRLAPGQSPEYLWIGCSDSRIPVSLVTGLQPGEAFVHRNIANLVPEDDPSCQAVIEYGVGVLGVSQIVVCGHYGCGGVLAALRGHAAGRTGDWISGIVALRDRHAAELGGLASDAERHARLCALNVIEQVQNLSRSAAVREAWSRGRPLVLHGWIYGLADGLLEDLDVSMNGPAA